MTSADIAESYGHTEYAKEIRKFEKQVGHFIFVNYFDESFSKIF